MNVLGFTACGWGVDLALCAGWPGGGARARCGGAPCCCAWRCGSSAGKARGCPGAAVGCVRAGWSRIRTVSRNTDILASYLKMQQHVQITAPAISHPHKVLIIYKMHLILLYVFSTALCIFDSLWELIITLTTLPLNYQEYVFSCNMTNLQHNASRDMAQNISSHSGISFLITSRIFLVRLRAWLLEIHAAS